ncbi:hypothetical protein HYW87_00015 [Candidatus Roizmanbacteria bacterium]|nr:hypothetical protein [Candidatus Roizmanbacteria bacterium]
MSSYGVDRKAFSEEHLAHTVEAIRERIFHMSEQFLVTLNVEAFFTGTEELIAVLQRYNCSYFSDFGTFAAFYKDRHILGIFNDAVENPRNDWIHERYHQVGFERHRVGSRIAVAECSDRRFLTFCEPWIADLRRACGGDPYKLAFIVGDSMMEPYRHSQRDSDEKQMAQRFLQIGKS